MAEYDRGAYDPDKIRVFDGSDEDDSDGSRLPILIVIALVVLASFAGVVWLAYEKGVSSGRNEPRIIEADSGPAKVAPENPGGTQTMYKGLKIYEQPAPSDVDNGAEAAATNPAQTPSHTTAPATSVPSLRAPLTEAASEKPPPAPQPSTAKSDTMVATAQPDVGETSQPPARQEKAPKPAPSKPAQAATKGSYFLQIGSYKSEEEANAAWQAATAKHASTLGGFSPDIKKVDLADKGTWYRLRVASFADKDAANALCEKLKSEGGTCLPSR